MCVFCLYFQHEDSIQSKKNDWRMVTKVAVWLSSIQTQHAEKVPWAETATPHRVFAFQKSCLVDKEALWIFLCKAGCPEHFVEIVRLLRSHGWIWGQNRRWGWLRFCTYLLCCGHRIFFYEVKSELKNLGVNEESLFNLNRLEVLKCMVLECS